jgi:hypothetical protein
MKQLKVMNSVRFEFEFPPYIQYVYTYELVNTEEIYKALLNAGPVSVP